VTIAANQTTATFTITTTSVTAPTDVTIAASAAGTTRTAVLNVTPLAAVLTAIAVTPPSVVGGTPANGMITLSSGAPSGGAFVILSSNSSSITVPPAVTIAAGVNTAAFTILTNAVAAPVEATITAIYGGTSRTASFVVMPTSTLGGVGVSQFDVGDNALVGDDRKPVAEDDEVRPGLR
jgi:hypothetical protein